MSAELDHIFVYGTLLGTARGAYGRAERRRLTLEGERLGPATVPGRLLDLGRYPGLIAEGESGDVVHGEVVRLRTPGPTLAWLDAYEGLTAGGGEADEYVRERLVASLGGGGGIAVWTYRYRGPTGGLPLLRGGRWPDRS